MKRRKSAEEVRRNMSAIRSRDNRTEVAIRKMLFAHGVRFRLHSQNVMGRPDLVFAKKKVVVFIDGDYWHARSLREHGARVVREKLPDDTADYWMKKFSGRITRDDHVTSELRRLGWTVLRFWESDAKRDIEGTCRQILTALGDAT